MNFDSCGPFEFPRVREGRWRINFWQEVEESWIGLSNAVGCYAFCIDNGHTLRPWYVGQTLAQGGFEAEVFTQHKLEHYTLILDPGDEQRGRRRGRPSIILFPLVTDNWELSASRNRSRPYVDWLEKTLIGMALSRNPDIANIGNTLFHRQVYLNGVIGAQYPGRPTGGATFARRAFLGE